MGTKHTLLLGGDYFREDFGLPFLNEVISPDLDIDIFDPVYHNERSGPFIRDPARDRTFQGVTSWYGLYLQDQIELPYHFHALAGFRYDNAEAKDNGQLSQADDRVSPRGGLLWRPIPELSLYGSYTENFGASNGRDDNNRALAPQTAQQWEMGAKTELWDGRFTASLAWYELTKQNIAVPDRDGHSRTLGEAETHGLEVELSGEILPGWRIIGGYSYMPFAKILKDFTPVTDADGNITGTGTTPGNTGNRLFGASEHQGNVWSTYEFQQANLKGFKFGAGVITASKFFGEAENLTELPSYAIVNLLASYERKVGSTKVTAQLNVDNLLDETYFNWQSVYGSPRTFLGSLRIEY